MSWGKWKSEKLKVVEDQLLGTYLAELAGGLGALTFFCFFSCVKTRKEGVKTGTAKSPYSVLSLITVLAKL